MLGTTARLARYVFAAALAVLVSTSVRAAEPIPIRIGWQPDSDVGLYVARANHFFEKVGLKPTFYKFLSGPAMFAAIQSNSIDVSDFGIAPLVAGIAHGLPVVAIGVVMNDAKVNGLVARPGLTVHSITDLRGKRVAATKGSLSYLGLGRALAQAGMTLSDIHYLNMPVTEILPAFEHGDIDAAWAWEPWAQKMVAAGGTMVMTNESIGNIVGDAWGARKAWLKESPEAAVRFIAAMDMGAKYVQSHPEESAAALAAELHVPQAMALEIVKKVGFPTVAEQMDPNNPSTVMDFKEGKIGLGKAARLTAEFFQAQGLITSFPPLHTVFDYTPMTTYFASQKAKN